MANPFSPGSSGSVPPSQSSPSTGIGAAIARRSSYASVLAGGRAAAAAAAVAAVTPSDQSRAGPFAHLAGSTSTSGSIAHSYPPPHSQSTTAPPFEIPQPRGSRHPSESWEKTHMSSYPNSMGTFGGDAFGPALGENRPPEFFVPSYLRGSRHIERLEERHKTRQSSHRDGRSGRSSNGGSLSTSASSHNLHKMVPSHRGMTYDIQENPYTRPEDIVSPLPSRWSSTDKWQGLEVSADGSEIKLAGTIKTQDEAAAVRADHSMPRECGLFYYEVTILGKTKDSLIGIGFSGPKVDLNRIPGWGSESWAYHGDDGHIFCETSAPKTYGPKFASSDVVGCGVNFRTGTAFFTLNGVHLGTAFRGIKAANLHPSIGLKKPGEHVRVNFGQHPFVFDIDGLVVAEKQQVREQIMQEDAGYLHGSSNEETLLQELVAQYLAHDGYIETAKAFTAQVKASMTALHGPSHTPNGMEYKEDTDAINRQRIRSAILDGDVDKALKFTNIYYPSVLRQNENIYFKLRCRKFIEMIRKCTDLQPTTTKSKRQSSSHSNGVSGRATSNGHAYAQNSLLSANHIHHDDYADVFDGRMELDEDDELSDLVNSNGGAGARDGATTTTATGTDFEPSSTTTTVESELDLMSAALQYGQELQSEFKDDPRREVKQALEDTFALIAYADARNSSLAPLLEVEGRAPVAEELNSAILVSLGKSSSAAMERLIQQTEVLVNEQSQEGGNAAFVNVNSDFLKDTRTGAGAGYYCF